MCSYSVNDIDSFIDIMSPNLPNCLVCLLACLLQMTVIENWVIMNKEQGINKGQFLK